MECRIIYIMGVSGSGKTTIGKKLAERSGIPFFDGDDFHSAHNKSKMKSGRALNDEDRKDWLIALNKLANEKTKNTGAIIACSALKETYRAILSQNIEIRIDWIFLHGDHTLISERMMSRKDHFMPPGLLQSQFEALEPPAYAILVNITGSEEEIVGGIWSELNLPENQTPSPD